MKKMKSKKTHVEKIYSFNKQLKEVYLEALKKHEQAQSEQVKN